MEIIFFIASSVALGLLGLAVFIYYLKKGQFDDSEEPKYQMFREKE